MKIRLKVKSEEEMTLFLDLLSLFLLKYPNRDIRWAVGYMRLELREGLWPGGANMCYVKMLNFYNIFK